MNEGMTKEELLDQFKGNKILKYATAAVGAIVLIILVFVAYNSFVYQPNNEESKAMVARGIMLMEKDSTALAIEEFEYIADEYGSYEGGVLAHYSLGNLYFEQGRFEDAIAALEKVDLEDMYLMTLATGTPALFLEAGNNALNGFIEIALDNFFLVITGRQEGCFVHQIGKISARKTTGGLSNFV